MNKRNQSLNSEHFIKNRRNAIIVISSLLILAITLLIIGQLILNAPPAKARNISAGVPSVSEKYYYDYLDVSDSYSLAMAAKLFQKEDGSIDIYFTNPESNKAHLMFEIYAGEELLVASRRIPPGYYLENITLNRIIKKDTPIVVKVYGLTPDSWISLGSCKLNLLLEAFQ